MANKRIQRCSILLVTRAKCKLNHTEIPHHSYYDGCNKKEIIVSVDKDAEKLESSYIVG